MVWATEPSGLEAVALSNRLKAELEGAEMKILSFCLGVSRMDRIGTRTSEVDSICWMFWT